MREVEHKTFFGRLMDSFFGILIGILLFFGSFFVIFLNEGSVRVGSLVESSTAIDSNGLSNLPSGELVSVTGGITSANTFVGDEFINGGPFVFLKRTVETYSWIEVVESNEDINTGGSSNVTTDYFYEKKWTERPSATSTFKDPSGHENSDPIVEDRAFASTEYRVGNYKTKSESIKTAPTLRITSDIIVNRGVVIGSDQVFVSGDGNSVYSNPNIGDARLSYTAIKGSDTVTIVGALSDNEITLYVNGDEEILRTFVGSRDEALNEAKKEDKRRIWTFRMIGFLMLLIGLMLVFGPISVLLDIVPVFGALSRGLIFLLSFVISIILWAVAVAISIIAHNIFLLIVSLVVTFGLIVYYLKKKRRKSVDRKRRSRRENHGGN